MDDFSDFEFEDEEDDDAVEDFNGFDEEDLAKILLSENPHYIQKCRSLKKQRDNTLNHLALNSS